MWDHTSTIICRVGKTLSRQSGWKAGGSAARRRRWPRGQAVRHLCRFRTLSAGCRRWSRTRRRRGISRSGDVAGAQATSFVAGLRTAGLRCRCQRGPTSSLDAAAPGRLTRSPSAANSPACAGVVGVPASVFFATTRRRRRAWSVCLLQAGRHPPRSSDRRPCAGSPRAGPTSPRPQADARGGRPQSVGSGGRCGRRSRPRRDDMSTRRAPGLRAVGAPTGDRLRMSPSQAGSAATGRASA